MTDVPPTGRRVFASPEARRRVAVHAAVALAALAVLFVVLRPYTALLTDPTALRTFIRGFGVWAPLAFVLLQALQVVVAPIPGQVLGVAAGYLFGLWWGTVYNVVGVALGSAAAFWLSRRFGRRYVERVVDEAALARFDAIDDDHVRVTLFVAFLLPGLPDDLLCLVGGLTGVPLWQLIAIAVVGRAPAFFLVNVLGDLLGTGRFASAVALAVVLAAVSVLGYRYRERLFGLLGVDG